jgi:pimeloyl-ACP methyl ester carboxylesterase
MLGVIAAGAVSVACGGGDESSSPSPSSPSPSSSATAPSAQAERCTVLLHGKGETGAAPTVAGDVATLRPTGNADGWGGRQWLYDDDRYDEARAIVADAIGGAGCRQAIVGGFSNGGAFAARLACAGDDFDGIVVGYVVDDPVPDTSTASCTRSEAMPVTVFWTGALDSTATPGQSCADIDWTCLGGSLVGIDAFAAGLGAEVTPSPLRSHEPYLDAPQLSAFG